MSDDFGNNYVVLTDEDGMDGETYMAFIPADLKVEEEAEVVILKVVEEDGEEILVSVDDDDEADRVFELVMDDVESMYDDAGDGES